MERWTVANKEITAFQNMLAPGLAKLSLLAAWDSTWPDAEYKLNRPKGFPSGMAGVYLLFDSSEALQYVGLATFCFDKRCWTHRKSFDYRFVDVVPIGDDLIFLGAALEMFLIRKLRPPRNANYKGGWAKLSAGGPPNP